MPHKSSLRGGMGILTLSQLKRVSSSAKDLDWIAFGDDAFCSQWTGDEVAGAAGIRIALLAQVREGSAFKALRAVVEDVTGFIGKAGSVDHWLALDAAIVEGEHGDQPENAEKPELLHASNRLASLKKISFLNPIGFNYIIL